jgi:hypothetical protein
MKTLRLTEAGLNELVKRIVEDKGSEGLFMDYHKESKATTGKKAISVINKIMDKLSKMKDKFENTNFAFSKSDLSKLEDFYDTLSGK